MTGFGLSSSIERDSEVYVEIKGVNHRYLEVSIKPNDLDNELEEYFRKVIAKNISRGKVDIRIKIKSPSTTKYSINTKNIKSLEQSVQSALKSKTNLTFKNIKDIPGILNIETSQKIKTKEVKREFNIALNTFIDSRRDEGKKIKEVLLKKVKGVESSASKILKFNKTTQKKRIKAYKLKVASLTKDLDETRINQEITLLALKHDVAEELDRIIFHTKSLNQELNKRGCSGKKIDFILQELFREANTLSVKLDDPKIKNLALDTKLLIEEMREQIQNVE